MDRRETRTRPGDGRHLDWDGCLNARDLGGLPAAGGHETRRAAIVRADAPDCLTADGWSAVQAHGIRTIVDLRNDDERTPDLALRPDGLTTLRLPLDGSEDREFWDRWSSGAQFGTPLYYRAFLDRFPERTARIVAAIAQAPPGGVLVHCVVGRDRTGLVTMLLLALVGVAPDDIAADYALSGERLPAASSNGGARRTTARCSREFVPVPRPPAPGGRPLPRGRGRCGGGPPRGGGVGRPRPPRPGPPAPRADDLSFTSPRSPPGTVGRCAAARSPSPSPRAPSRCARPRPRRRRSGSGARPASRRWVACSSPRGARSSSGRSRPAGRSRRTGASTGRSMRAAAPTAVRVVDVAAAKVIQSLPIPGGYVGVGFAPDGRTAYVSGEPTDGKAPPGAKGAGGDVIHVFAVDPASGHATEGDPIALAGTRAGQAAQDELPPKSSAKAWPEGLAVTPDGKRLVVALGQADQAAIVDLASRHVTLADVGRYPYGVAIDPHRPRAYVTSEYDGTVSVVDLASGALVKTIGVGGPAGDRYAHAEGIAADPTADRVYVAVTNRDLVAVIDTAHLAVEQEISVRRPEAGGSSPVAVAVAPTGARSTSRTPTRMSSWGSRSPTAGRAPRRGRGTSCGRARSARSAATAGRSPGPGARRRGGAWRGASGASSTRSCTARPSGPAPGRGRRPTTATRAASCGPTGPATGRSPAAARDEPPAGASPPPCAAPAGRCPRCAPAPRPGELPGVHRYDVIGRLPTAWYPTGVSVSGDGQRLVWLAGRGYGSGSNKDGTDISQTLVGRAGVLDRPSDRELRAMTARAEAQTVPTDTRPRRPARRSSAPAAGRAPRSSTSSTWSRRTGPTTRSSAPSRAATATRAIELFDDNGVPGPAGGVTPNAHALTRTFPLLDHVLADSEASTDGHKITSGSISTDYTNRYVSSSRGRKGNPDIFPIGLPANGFVFDQAVRQGISFQNFGELGAGNQPFADDGRPTFQAVVRATDPSYPTQLNGSCEPAYPRPPGTPNTVALHRRQRARRRHRRAGGGGEPHRHVRARLPARGGGRDRARVHLHDPVQRPHQRDRPRRLHAQGPGGRQRPRARPARGACQPVVDLGRQRDLRAGGRQPVGDRPRRRAPHPRLRDQPVGAAARSCTRATTSTRSCAPPS